MFRPKTQTIVTSLTYTLALLLGCFTICLPAYAQGGITAIALTVSDSNPTYNEMVTLTATVTASGNYGGTIYFYEDPGSLVWVNNDHNGSANDNSVHLGTAPINSPQTSVQLKMPFMGGQHNVYAMLLKQNGNPVTSNLVLLNVMAALNVPSHQVYLGSATDSSALVNYIRVDDGGSGYPFNSNFPVTIASPGCTPNGTTCVPAAATAYVDASGHVSAINVTNQGNGYTSVPSVALPSGSATALMGSLELLEGFLGRPLAIHTLYYSDNDTYNKHWYDLSNEVYPNTETFKPDPYLQDDISIGRVPLISWGCNTQFQPDPNYPQYSNSDAAIAGGFDGGLAGGNNITYITHTADVLRQYPGPVLLRWTWEFNGFWAGHDTCVGNTDDSTWTSQQMKDFVGAWQRIWTIFQQEHATNVVFVWNPMRYQPTPLAKKAQDPKDFYPGDQFVDWIGVDSYQDNDAAGTLLAQDIDNTQYPHNPAITNWYSEYSIHGKPMLVGENGSPGFNTKGSNPESQASYLEDSDTLSPGYPGAQQIFDNNTFPLLHAYCWFDVSNNVLDLADSTIAGSDPYENPPGTNTGLAAMNTLANDYPTVKSSDLTPAAGFPTSTDNGTNYAMALNVTNTGLLPMTTIAMTISDVTVQKCDSGTCTVTPPTGTVNLNTLPLQPTGTLTAGQIGTATPIFSTWSKAASCVAMTINFTGEHSDGQGDTIPFSRSKTIYVSPKTGPLTSCP